MRSTEKLFDGKKRVVTWMPNPEILSISYIGGRRSGAASGSMVSLQRYGLESFSDCIDSFSQGSVGARVASQHTAAVVRL
jgi:hypothetical protein